MATHNVTTTWKKKMQFESTNPSGETLLINAGAENGGEGAGLRPKAMMLSALAGCTGLDVAAMIAKMKLEVSDFKIETIANLTEEDPKFYDNVVIEYHFYGNDLNEQKLQRAVNLSSEKYCGVMDMFRKFATLEIKTIFHK